MRDGRTTRANGDTRTGNTGPITDSDVNNTSTDVNGSINAHADISTNGNDHLGDHSGRGPQRTSPSTTAPSGGTGPMRTGTARTPGRRSSSPRAWTGSLTRTTGSAGSPPPAGTGPSQGSTSTNPEAWT